MKANAGLFGKRVL